MFSFSFETKKRWKGVGDIQGITTQFVCCLIFRVWSAVPVAVDWYLCLKFEL